MLSPVRGCHVLTCTDLFLASPALLTAVAGCNILPAYCSDHNPLFLDLVLGEQAPG